MSLLSSIIKLIKNAEPTAPAAEALIPFIRTDTTYRVVNAGERVVIGVYTRRTSFGLTFNGKPYFTLRDEDDSDPNGAKRHCLYYQDGWKITDAEGDIAYTSNAAETPDLAEWSVASAGTLFLPIVVEGQEESVLNQVSLEDLSNSNPYLEYSGVFQLNDSGIVATVVSKNTLGGDDPVLTRLSAGNFAISHLSFIAGSEISVQLGSIENDVQSDGVIVRAVVDSGQATIWTYDLQGQAADPNSNSCSICIRVPN